MMSLNMPPIILANTILRRRLHSSRSGLVLICISHANHEVRAKKLKELSSTVNANFPLSREHHQPNYFFNFNLSLLKIEMPSFRVLWYVANEFYEMGPDFQML